MGESVGTTSTPAVANTQTNSNNSSGTSSQAEKASAEETKQRARQRAASARKNQSSAKEAAAQAQARRQSGTEGMNQGGMQKAMGATQVGIGSLQVGIGAALLAKAAASAGLFSMDSAVAWGMVIAGTGQQVNGGMMIAQGNQKIDKGTGMLAEAAELGLISKQEASAANKEMIRSQLLESKAAMKEMTAEMMQQQNQQLPPEQQLSEEQLQNFGANLDKIYDKAFQAGAETLKNGGITTMETEDGPRYFIKDEANEGAITEVSIQTDENGEAALDEHGRLQVDEKLGAVNTEDGPKLTAEETGELVITMSVVMGMERMITGDDADGIPPLARIEIDHETGSISKGKFNINDPEQMNEFAMIAATADEEPPPLKFIEDEETGDLYFQEWNWDNDTAIGEKISLKDIAGGENADKDLAQATLAKTGLQEGGSRYQVLEHIVNYAEETDNNGLPDFADYQSFIIGGRPTVGASTSHEDQASSILDSVDGDEVPEGHA